MAGARLSAATSAPSLPLPPALRGADGEDTFTYVSVVERLGKILEATLDNNPDLPDADVVAMRRVQSDACDAAAITLLPAPARTAAAAAAGSDADADHPWNVFVRPHVDAGRTWLTAPWWFVEHYFYERIKVAVGYPHRLHDPFERQKRASLESLAPSFAATMLPLADAEEPE